MLDGTDIADAQAGYQTDSLGNQTPVVQLTMTEEGTQKFADATEAAAPNHDIIYIIYDGEVVKFSCGKRSDYGREGCDHGNGLL